ncbi:hypothetical protein HD553DRAFT_356436 [Filobasidium floriforme]|uniref:uncharacterized protein n=1 Tax=Filobasidium floriforme TaxID=5210 RepID=UPI001E8D4E79|nr:uncharacterized protein HD553DRAFT_356436 [Filobasidium floriforme]KAH8084240.1 hypothetical protein HD553DRAFT_356436 [Filobasidium floriforme]
MTALLKLYLPLIPPRVSAILCQNAVGSEARDRPMPEFPSGSEVGEGGSRLSRRKGNRRLRTKSSSGQDDASGIFDADERQSSPPTSIAHTNSELVPLTPESYATRLEYNPAEGHWGPAKVSVASTLRDRDPSETGSEYGQEDHSSILSETGTKPLAMQRSLGRSTFLYKVGEDIEEQANQYFNHRGRGNEYGRCIDVGPRSLSSRHALTATDQLSSANHQPDLVSGYSYIDAEKDDYHDVMLDVTRFYDPRGKVTWVQANIGGQADKPVRVGCIKGMIYEGDRKFVLVLLTIPLKEFEKTKVGCRVLSSRYYPHSLGRTLREMKGLVDRGTPIGEFGEIVRYYASAHLTERSWTKLWILVQGNSFKPPRSFLGCERIRSSQVPDESYDSQYDTTADDTDFKLPSRQNGDDTIAGSDTSKRFSTLGTDSLAHGLPERFTSHRQIVQQPIPVHVEKQAQGYYHPDGKVTWIWSTLHQKSLKEYPVGYIKGFYFHRRRTVLLILRAIPFNVPIDVLRWYEIEGPQCRQPTGEGSQYMFMIFQGVHDGQIPLDAAKKHLAMLARTKSFGDQRHLITRTVYLMLEADICNRVDGEMPAMSDSETVLL